MNVSELYRQVIVQYNFIETLKMEQQEIISKLLQKFDVMAMLGYLYWIWKSLTLVTTPLILDEVRLTWFTLFAVFTALHGMQTRLRSSDETADTDLLILAYY